MMTETPKTNPTEPKHLPFGMRLQSAREALGLESKDAAAQLRLNEEVILMMEKDCYSSHLPPIFVRGYIRSYGKLLQIPEDEIKLAIEPIQPKVVTPSVPPTTKQMPALTSSNYFVQMFTYLVGFTLIGLAATWWYTHSTTSPIVENQLSLPVEKLDPNIALPVQVKTDAVTTSINLGAKLTESTAPVVAKKSDSTVSKIKTTDATDTADSTDVTDTIDNNNIETNSDNAD